MIQDDGELISPVPSYFLLKFVNLQVFWIYPYDKLWFFSLRACLSICLYVCMNVLKADNVDGSCELSSCHVAGCPTYFHTHSSISYLFFYQTHLCFHYFADLLNTQYPTLLTLSVRFYTLAKATRATLWLYATATSEVRKQDVLSFLKTRDTFTQTASNFTLVRIESDWPIRE